MHAQLPVNSHHNWWRAIIYATIIKVNATQHPSSTPFHHWNSNTSFLYWKGSQATFVIVLGIKKWYKTDNCNFVFIITKRFEHFVTKVRGVKLAALSSAPTGVCMVYFNECSSLKHAPTAFFKKKNQLSL